MDLILNPIILSVLVLCVLCLVRVNVLLALIFAGITAGISGHLEIGQTMTLLADGFSANATTALSSILLGTFAVAIADTGLMQMLVAWLSKHLGIGTSFGTVPILAVIYVPLCQAVGFSLPATILLMSAAGALGDAGSPASDTTLGPTSGLNADGQHDHIWDTCVPTFIAYNIPLMLAGISGAQFL